MKRAFIFIIAVVSLLNLNGANGAETNSHIKVGVYDSRSIAIAYTGSKFHNDWMQSLKQRRDEAVSKKDDQRVKVIEQEASDRQTLLHKQGFGTFPVDDILTVVSNQVSKIQADAHVSDLISKWDSAQLAKIPESNRVDVTESLISIFEPNERSLKWAREIQSKKPVPSETLEGHSKAERH